MTEVLCFTSYFLRINLMRLGHSWVYYTHSFNHHNLVKLVAEEGGKWGLRELAQHVRSLLPNGWLVASGTLIGLYCFELNVWSWIELI